MAGKNSDHNKFCFEKNEKNEKCLELPDLARKSIRKIFFAKAESRKQLEVLERGSWWQQLVVMGCTGGPSMMLQQVFSAKSSWETYYLTEVHETHALVIFKLMKHMKNPRVMFGSLINDRVYRTIAQLQCEDDVDEGIARETIRENWKDSYQPLEVDGALDFLAGEGHIYSTIDEDHFKTTDGEYLKVVNKD